MSEWIRSRDRNTWPLKRGGRCGEATASGGSTVQQISSPVELFIKSPDSLAAAVLFSELPAVKKTKTKKKNKTKKKQTKNKKTKTISDSERVSQFIQTNLIFYDISIIEKLLLTQGGPFRAAQGWLPEEPCLHKA